MKRLISQARPQDRPQDRPQGRLIANFLVFDRCLYLRSVTKSSDEALMEQLLSLIQTTRQLGLFKPWSTDVYISYECSMTDKGLLQIHKCCCRSDNDDETWTGNVIYSAILDYINQPDDKAVDNETVNCKTDVQSNPSLNQTANSARDCWHKRLNTLNTEDYIVIRHNSEEAQLLESILARHQGERLSAAVLVATSDMQSYLKYQDGCDKCYLPLSGMRVRDGTVTVTGYQSKLIFSYRHGLAHGPYWLYNSTHSHQGQCYQGHKVGKEYSFEMFDRINKRSNWLSGPLTTITDHDHHYQVYKDSDGVKLMLKQHSYPYYSFQLKDGILDYHVNRRLDSGVFELRGSVIFKELKSLHFSHTSDEANNLTHIQLSSCGQAIDTVSFNHKSFRLLGASQSLTWSGRLYYLTECLALSIAGLSNR